MATKLFVPLVKPGLVLRPRLVECLQYSLQCCLTLISALAGFGKTTILTQWITQNKIRAAWVSLDAGDNDTVRFWDYLITAINKLQPAIGEKALSLLHAPLRYSIESVLTVLINDIAVLSEEFVIILDDYHVITSEAINAGVAFLLEHLPPNVHLVVATRTDPDLPLPHFRGRGTLGLMILIRVCQTLASELPDEALAFLVDALNMAESKVLFERSWMRGSSSSHCCAKLYLRA